MPAADGNPASDPGSDDDARVVRLWTAERVPLSVPLAGIGERALAYAIDLSIVIAAGMAGLFVYNFWGDIEQDIGNASGVALLFALLIAMVLVLGYDVLFEQLAHGVTPGKRLLRLRVVTQEGRAPDPVASVLRNVVRLLDMLPWGYAVGTVVLFLSRTRRLGDLVAGTVVVSERSRGTSALRQARELLEQTGEEPLHHVGELAPGDLLTLLRVWETSAALDERRADTRLARTLLRLAPAEARGLEALPGRVAAAKVLVGLANRRAGLAAELVRIDDATEQLQAALADLDAARTIETAERADDAIRHAASTLMRATRRAVPARRQEALSLTLLDAERRRVRRVREPGRLRRFFVEEVPRTIYEERALVWRAAAVMFGGAGLGFGLAFVDPDVGRALLGDDLAGMVDEGARWTDDIEQSGGHANAAFQIILNNVRVGLVAFVAGLTGLGTLIILLLNGLHLGAVFGFAASLQSAGTLGKFILAHGPVELTAICVAGAGGLCVGRALLRPGHRHRGAALRIEAARGLRLVAGASLAFLLIGTVEGYVSPGALFPWPVNAAVGVGMWLLFFGWIRTYGAREAAAAPSSPTSSSRASAPAA